MGASVALDGFEPPSSRTNLVLCPQVPHVSVTFPTGELQGPPLAHGGGVGWRQAEQSTGPCWALDT